MLKIKIDDRNGITGISYKCKKTNSYEHIVAIARIYKEIKEQSKTTDKEIKDLVKYVLEQMEEK